MGNLPECKFEPEMMFRNTGTDFLDLCLSRKDVVKLKCMVVCLLA